MPLFQIVSDRTEFTVDQFFTTIFAPLAIIETGANILIRIGQRLIVGRWFPSVAGCDWILQPARLIRITGRIAFQIIGVIAPYFGGFSAQN